MQLARNTFEQKSNCMKTLLIVEDNMMMREFLKSYFSSEYEVVTCDNANNALTSLDQGNEPDLILLDYELDGSDGFKFLTTLKTSGFYKDVPVIFLSGNLNSSVRISCLEAGAEDFVCKPFNPVELGIKVKKFMN